MSSSPLLVALVFVAALLFSMVGHAGASGYLVAMALLGATPEFMKPTSLVLNTVVAAITSYQFCRAGLLRWRMFWPLATASVPLAFVGGAIMLPDEMYRLLIAAVLALAAYRLFVTEHSEVVRPMPIVVALIAGALVGLVSGVTGVGGGIFLTPMLIFAGWATPRMAVAISSAFILVNSLAGVLGYVAGGNGLPGGLPLLCVSAAGGGWIGSTIGSRALSQRALRRGLAVLLFASAVKFAIG